MRLCLPVGVMGWRRGGRCSKHPGPVQWGHQLVHHDHKDRTMAMWSYAVCERLRSACKMQKKYEKTGLFGKFGIWAQNMTKQQSKSEAQSFTLGGDCIIICLSSVLLWFRLVCGR